MTTVTRARPRPRIGAGEPSPALRLLFDLPLKHEIDEGVTARIDQLSLRAKDLDPEEGDWLPVYDEAISIAEEAVRSTEERVEEIQRSSLVGDDPMEIKQRFVNVPRKEADTARNDVKQALQKAAKEWIDRTKRQHEHVCSSCDDAAKTSVELREEQGEVGKHLVVADTWWSEMGGFAARCADEWSKSALAGADEALHKAASKASLKLMRLTNGDAIRPPQERDAPPTEVEMGDPPPPAKLDVPSFGDALGKYVRQRVMAVGIFGTALTVLFVVLSGVISGDDPNAADDPAAGGGGASSMMVRGGLMLAVLPITLIFGYVAVRRERAEATVKVRDTAQANILSHTHRAFEKALERHRGAVERWIQARVDDYVGSLDEYWERNVEAALAKLEKEGADAVAQAKLAQTKTSEKLTGLRALKNQLSQQLVFELRKQHRDLELKARAEADGAAEEAADVPA